MAPRSKAAAKQAETEQDFTAYVDKDPTDLQERFAEWLQGDAVGYNPAAAKSKTEAFEEGVRLGTALRMQFQRSPENQAILEERRAEAEDSKRARATEGPKRRGRPRKAAPEPEPEDVEEDAEEEQEEAPKPRRATRARKTSATTRKTAAKPPAKRPTRRRAKAAAETDDVEDAPF